MQLIKKICLIGNPNSGKTSLFNKLTGLQQKVSNFPGVTVECKSGLCKLGGKERELIDLPGTYSLFPNSKDEKIVVDILTDPASPHYPDAIIYVCDINSLEKHLLLATQLLDLHIPMIIVLNMTDTYQHTDNIDKVANLLATELGVQVIPTSIIKSQGLNLLDVAFSNPIPVNKKETYNFANNYKDKYEEIKRDLNLINTYHSKLIAHHHQWLSHLNKSQRQSVNRLFANLGFEDLKEQVKETMGRYEKIQSILRKSKYVQSELPKSTLKIDNIVTHPIWGTLLFLSIMLVVFQSIFSFAELPMEWIETGFAKAAYVVGGVLPDTWYSNLITEGLIAGLGGVLVFIPQIALLFIFISLLEESGYMSRVVYMLDPIMRKFGLNGRSAVALISSGACAIPAIMSTRTISNWKERLTTIMVSPLISCSARIPVYAVLVGFVVPATYWGPFRLQGLVFMGLYLLGIIAAMVTAGIFTRLVKSDEVSFLAMELPVYKKPIWSNVLYQVKEKVWSFVKEAGKVIIIISIILWFLASYGPSGTMEAAQAAAIEKAAQDGLNEEETDNLIAATQLESSYAGLIGKWVEPAIKPLGFDWKIGIALITSFAAREVFVGTMSTIYSIGSEANEETVRDKMSRELRSGSNMKMYTPATALSLLVFYVFALQCMSTLAVTKKETNSYKWPLIQFVYMGLLAYVGSFITYQLMS